MICRKPDDPVRPMLVVNRDHSEQRAPGAAALQCSGAVVTAFPLATAAGLELLRAGGNAIDAAVGAAWTLCACEPSASGLGGQTILLIRFADGRTRVIDGHSCAPLAACLDTVSASQQRRGYRSCTIPTTPATLDWVQRKYGTLGRDRVMAPAIRAAEEGYAITPLQRRQIAWVAHALRESTAAELFLQHDSPPGIGHVFRQPELARTLRRLADLGAVEFYRGALADRIVRDMQANGGLLTEADLGNCRPPIESEPLVTVYRGHRVMSVAPPGGGFQLLLALNVLARLAASGFESANEDWREAIALATSAVFRERELRAPEPDGLADQLRRRLASDAYSRGVAFDIAGLRFGSVDRNETEEPGDTTHLSACDRHGNIVMLTQSIQSLFGAKVAHRELGFLYNNYLRTCPRHPHPYGLRPGCRPRSNAAPTLVLRRGCDGERPLLALGGAGSRRIISAILQVISGVVDLGLDIAAAVSAPRVHGLLGRKVWIERPAVSDALLARLQTRGRDPVVKSSLNFGMGSVQALQFFPEARVGGAADPRRDGNVGVLH